MVSKSIRERWRKYTYQFSLLTMSPYPGVSTMFNRRRTPFSVITSEQIPS